MRFLLLTMLAALISGCIPIRTEHRIEPIHMTVDVYLRVTQELEDVFRDIDRESGTLKYENVE